MAIDYVKENVPSRPPLPWWGVVVALAAAAAAFGVAALVDRALPPPRARRDTPPNQFIAEIAYEHLVNFTNIGPRVAGSYENEVAGVGVALAAAREIARAASKHNVLELDLQRASGGFSLSFFDGMNNVYRDVQNVVVRARGVGGRAAAAPRRAALLLNCHIDTVPDSPGASDDAAGCAVGLETVRALVAAPRPLRHDVILLLNGAEENIMQASHAFITQHKWAPSVRAFINMEACGAGGREVLFQAGPYDPWIVEMYARAVPHPLASSMAQEMFEFGLIPADTDFRIFRDFGKLSGVDLAWSSGGYAYHTALDTAERVPPASLQRTGDNVLALAEGLVSSEHLEQASEGGAGAGQPVFFDVLGAFVVVARAPAALAAAALALALLLLRLRLNAAQAHRDREYNTQPVSVDVLGAFVVVARAPAALAAAALALALLLLRLRLNAAQAHRDREYNTQPVSVDVLGAFVVVARAPAALAAAALALALLLLRLRLNAAQAHRDREYNTQPVSVDVLGAFVVVARAPAALAAAALALALLLLRLRLNAAQAHRDREYNTQPVSVDVLGAFVVVARAPAALAAAALALALLLLRLRLNAAQAHRDREYNTQPVSVDVLGAFVVVARAPAALAAAALALALLLLRLRLNAAQAHRDREYNTQPVSVDVLGAFVVVARAPAALAAAALALALLLLRLRLNAAQAHRDREYNTQPVSVDVLGAFVVVARAPAALAAAALALALLLLRLRLNAAQAHRDLYIGKNTWYKEVAMESVRIVVAGGGSVCVAAGTGLALHVTGARLAYYARPALLLPLLVLPALAHALRTYSARAPGSACGRGWWSARRAADALALCAGALVGGAACARMRTGYVPWLWLVLPTLGDLGATAAGAGGRARACCWAAGWLLPALQTSYMARDTLALLVPLCGRAGAPPLPVDMVMGAVVSGMVLAAANWLAVVAAAARGLNRTAWALGLCSLFTILLAMAGLLGPAYTAERPQRLMVFHVRRHVHAPHAHAPHAPHADHAPTIEDYYWVPELDANTAATLDNLPREHGPRVAAHGASACGAWVYCGAPYFLPVLQFVPAAHRLPAAAPPPAHAAVSATITTRELEPGVHELRLHIVGPSHVVVIVSPVAGGVAEWCDAVEPLRAGARWGARQTYFIAMHAARAPGDTPRALTLRLRVPIEAEMDNPSEEKLAQISVAGHAMSGSRADAHAALLRALPVAAARSGWPVHLHLYRV